MLSRDPLGGGLAAPASQNRYAYALDNPTTLMDPSGLSTIMGQDLSAVGQQMIDTGGAVQAALLAFFGQAGLSAGSPLLVGLGVVATVLGIILAALQFAGFMLQLIGSAVQHLPLWLAIVLLAVIVLIVFLLLALLIWALVGAAIAAASVAAFFTPVAIAGLGAALGLFLLLAGIGLGTNQWASGQPTTP